MDNTYVSTFVEEETAFLIKLEATDAKFSLLPEGITETLDK